ncbi:hypothetical protein GCM10010218_02840 [Streptomyces mashuensis]|uniref:HTH luxR-type domain-containing protein n=1 Tax=Streptomyces mashuensis TaxID=33904 RepID=A0A919ATN9_9ACTN|nr:helix-turn-helix domain-containing protein [Streptomyces mashuensis]GHF25576.1 hypothetical protein GCM10010218_02840 [Streptomyces mashuensis]
MLTATETEAGRRAAHGETPGERGDGRGRMEVVTGVEAVTRQLARLRLGAVNEVCAMLTEASGELTERPWAAPPPAPGAVPQRTVVERAAPGAVPGGALLRVVDRIPAELVIADRRGALLPLVSGTTECAALLVGPGPLLNRLVDLFEDLWHEGRPPLPVPPLPVTAAPDALDLRVLDLLLAGLTDASAAKQLGVGLRTVQRRVKRLMELAGVTTRLQLGWYAAEQGWAVRD